MPRELSIGNVLHELEQLCDGESLDPPSEHFVEKLSKQHHSGEAARLNDDHIARLRELHERYCA